MTRAQEKEWKIGSILVVKGPSEFDLMLSLFEHKTVYFTIQSDDVFNDGGRGAISVDVESVDRSFTSFNGPFGWKIKGIIKDIKGQLNSHVVEKFRYIFSSVERVEFEGFYRITDRQGVIAIANKRFGNELEIISKEMPIDIAGDFIHKLSLVESGQRTLVDTVTSDDGCHKTVRLKFDVLGGRGLFETSIREGMLSKFWEYFDID